MLLELLAWLTANTDIPITVLIHSWAGFKGEVQSVCDLESQNTSLLVLLMSRLTVSRRGSDILDESSETVDVTLYSDLSKHRFSLAGIPRD